MNLLVDDIEDLAEKIKLKILARGQQCIYAKRSGLMAIYAVNDPRNTWAGEGDLIGSYTRQAKVADIEDDLIARRREIAA